MCILFLYCNQCPRPGAFRLVLAMNRDEVLSRPTQQASWGEGDGDFLGGRDLEKGREGGTWMGVDRRGRLAMLTNIFTGGAFDPTGLARGDLVPNFLRKPDSPREYLDNFVREKRDCKYNPFNLCLLQMDADGVYRGQYMCRGKSKVEEGPSSLAQEFFGLSNHPASSPFLKTKAGLEAFKSVVSANNDPACRDSLLDGLVSVMSDRQKHQPDPQVTKQARDAGQDFDEWRLSAGFAVYVDIGGVYGTRQQTFVLVDYDRNVTFVERSRAVGDDGGEKWTEKRFNFEATNE